MSRVTWWRNGDLIDNVYEEIAPGKSRNTMKVEILKREDAAAEFTCIGNNNNDTQPVTNTVKISLNCKFFKKNVPNGINSSLVVVDGDAETYY